MTPPDPHPRAGPHPQALDRRQLLKLAAASAAAWATGCPGKKAQPKIPKAAITGELRGQDPTLGHLLRDGGLPQGPPAETQDLEVLILGGGVAGLSAAWRLRREGVAAPILEAASQPGGNSRSGQVEGVSPHPWGAHYLRAPTVDHPALETFLEEAGLITGRDSKGRIDYDTGALCLAPMERLWEDGLWTDGLFPPPRSRSPEDTKQYRAFGAEVERLSLLRGSDGKPAFAIPIDKSSQDPELLALDRITFREWLTQRSLSAPGLLWYVEYACRDDYGCSLDTTSAWAGLHYFCSRNRGPQTRDETLAWPEGNARLVQHLTELHGPTEVTPSSFAYRILPGQEPGAPSEAWVLHVSGQERRYVRYRAQELIWAGPNFVLDRLLGRPPTPGFSYAPWLIANVVLRSLPGGFGAPLAWDNVPYGKPSLGYVVANRERVPGHPLVVTWYLPFTGADDRAERARLFAMDHAAVVDMVTSELLEIHPALSGEIVSVDSWRWGHAMARPTPGFIWGARQQAREGTGSLIQAHSDLSGISVFEEAFYQGVVAGEEVLKRRGTAFSTIL